jgi:urease accessory protein
MLRRRASLLATTIAAVAAPLPALAHHAMGGAVPVTAWEGLVSGIAHPVTGLDHLAFLLAAGVLAAAAPRRGGTWSLVAFLGAGLVGALLHLDGVGLGPVEAVIALSVRRMTASLPVLMRPLSMGSVASKWRLWDAIRAWQCASADGAAGLQGPRVVSQPGRVPWRSRSL